MATAPAAAEALRLPNRFDSGIGNAPITEVTLPDSEPHRQHRHRGQDGRGRCEKSPAINDMSTATRPTAGNSDQSQCQILPGQDPAEIDPRNHIGPEGPVVHSEEVEAGARHHPGNDRGQERCVFGSDQEPARPETERRQSDDQADRLRPEPRIPAHVAEFLARRRVDRAAPSPEDSGTRETPSLTVRTRGLPVGAGRQSTEHDLPEPDHRRRSPPAT